MLGAEPESAMPAMDPSSFAEFLVARTSHWGRIRRYALATAVVAAVTLVRIVFEAVLQANNYFLFVIAVALCATFLDWGPAAWATILSSSILEYAFLEPRFTVTLEPEHVVPLALFVVGCVLIIIGGQSMRLLVQKLNRSQAEKDALYRELRHRTANNLQIIGATIAMEASRTGPEARGSLNSVAGRISAIAQIDQLLGASGADDTVDATTYVKELCGFIATSLVGRRPIALSCDTDFVKIPRDVAETVGIAINELVTNALKYAFAEAASGNIRVGLASAADGIVLTVEDDGRGCTARGEGGTGWRLVSSLAGRHRGTMAVEDANPGCRVRIHLPCASQTGRAKAV
jgi:two-component sensor histidine kinase